MRDLIQIDRVTMAEKDFQNSMYVKPGTDNNLERDTTHNASSGKFESFALTSNANVNVSELDQTLGENDSCDDSGEETTNDDTEVENCVTSSAPGNKDGGGSGKPNLSYIALISMAIQSSSNQRLLLSEIYHWINENFPYFRSQDRSWRNSIRHNLSLNECFIKSGRADNGKGNYWAIHPANVDDFSRGDYRRRRARRRVRKCNDEMQRLLLPVDEEPANVCVIPTPPHIAATAHDRYAHPLGIPAYSAYVPMLQTLAPSSILASMFGVDAVLTREERLGFYHHSRMHGQVHPSPLTTATVVPSVQQQFIPHQHTREFMVTSPCLQDGGGTTSSTPGGAFQRAVTHALPSLHSILPPHYHRTFADTQTHAMLTSSPVLNQHSSGGFCGFTQGVGVTCESGDQTNSTILNNTPNRAHLQSTEQTPPRYRDTDTMPLYSAMHLGN